MRIEDFTFEVRDESLNRLGQLLPGDLVGWESVLRFNNVGSWSIQLMANVPMAELLSTPGYGIIVTHKDAGVVLSGPTISAETTYESGDPIGVITIMGVDDSVILADRLAYPSPASADVANQTSAYDSVSFMTASTAMNWYVERNLVPGVAPAVRAVAGLTIGTDPIIGSGISKSARFNVLGELLTEIASVDHLGFDIKQVDGTLEFQVFQPTDRTGTIRMDVANQTLAKTSYGYGAPLLTHAIVAGQGEGLNRQFLDITTTASAASESLFNRRIESFIDQRNTSDVDELTQAGLEKLADGGMTQTSVDVIPSSDLTMRYGTDWNLGDQVTVVVANQEVSATVTQVSIRVESNGVFVGATVGEPNGVDFESIVAKKSTSQQTRVNALERKEVPAIVWNDAEGTYEFVMKGGQVTQQIGAEQLAYTKNATGSLIANGSAVYPNGSTGTNQLIALAQANSESASTRTFGVVTEDIANGGHGWVTTFGMVHDINTSALTEGQPVWLSPTVAGGLTSTKPTSPNHMVLIGFCVRQHAVNGSIFVKVQNGFELDELHDVQINAVATGHVLVRNVGNTAWQNKTLADAGIASSVDLAGKAPLVHTHAVSDIVNLGFSLKQTMQFTSSGTFTKATYPWLRAIRVKCQAGGGGGGGVGPISGGQVVSSKSGSGGVYAESLITNIAGLSASIAVTVGAGGAGGAAGFNAGVSGGASSFGSLVVASGGNGGGLPDFTYPPNFPAMPTVGPASGTGDLIIPGGDSGQGFALNVGWVKSGDGGSSFMSTSKAGAIGIGTVGDGSNGPSGNLYGGGGVAGCNVNGATASRYGGAGAQGIVILELFA